MQNLKSPTAILVLSLITFNAWAASLVTPAKNPPKVIYSSNGKNSQSIVPSTEPTEKDYEDMVRKEGIKPSAALAQGGDSGGGGGMVVVSDGMVKLVDLINPNERFLDRIKRMSPAEYNEYINDSVYRDQGPLRSLGHIGLFSEVFSNSLAALEESYSEFPLFASLAYNRCWSLTTTTFFFDPRIKLGAKANENNFYSPRLPRHIQEPAAYFFGNTIILSARLLDLMDARNLKALGIHECLRNLNGQALDVGLNTSEIEAVTRYYMKVTLPGDPALVASAKAKTLKPKNVPWIRNALRMGAARYEISSLLKRLQNGDSSVTDREIEKCGEQYKQAKKIVQEDMIHQITIEQDCYFRLFASLEDNRLRWNKNLRELNQMSINDIIQAHTVLLPKFCK
ncbi:hypothetical protein [Bdellovibrio sp. KM01]|uniref:hypothetical protein n=1 Tax=Bdellovibrio sp. KM01 TaxID=2748865 RepID=UPI0015E936BB|nr:hypothetical protein [Bdellovibrio sp. KM01]QLY24648.1 hypothetical protein HW988_14480 [Bdellovibrio sp. KM01]